MKTITLEAGKYYMIDGFVSPQLIHIVDVYTKKGLLWDTTCCTYREITIRGTNGLLMNEPIKSFVNIIKEIDKEDFTHSFIRTM